MPVGYGANLIGKFIRTGTLPTQSSALLELIEHLFYLLFGKL